MLKAVVAALALVLLFGCAPKRSKPHNVSYNPPKEVPATQEFPQKTETNMTCTDMVVGWFEELKNEKKIDVKDLPKGIFNYKNSKFFWSGHIVDAKGELKKNFETTFKDEEGKADVECHTTSHFGMVDERDYLLPRGFSNDGKRIDLSENVRKLNYRILGKTVTVSAVDQQDPKQKGYFDIFTSLTNRDDVSVEIYKLGDKDFLLVQTQSWQSTKTSGLKGLIQAFITFTYQSL